MCSAGKLNALPTLCRKFRVPTVVSRTPERWTLCWYATVAYITRREYTVVLEYDKHSPVSTAETPRGDARRNERSCSIVIVCFAEPPSNRRYTAACLQLRKYFPVITAENERFSATQENVYIFLMNSSHRSVVLTQETGGSLVFYLAGSHCV